MDGQVIFRKQYKNTSAIGTTAPNNEYEIEIDDNDIKDFAPFNRIKVINTSSNDIGLRFIRGDSTHEEYIQAGEVYISEYDLFYNIFIVNKSSTFEIPANKIIVIVRKVGVYGIYGGWSSG